MKKLILALLCAIVSLCSYGQTFIPSTIPDMVLPGSTDSAVYIPVKTSSYAYDNVLFKITETDIQLQNLYVYSWNSANQVDGGIAWVRRNTSGILQDTGYIRVPGRKTCRSVGIVQSSTGNTYVIACYYDVGTSTIANGYKYETYLWNGAGLGGLSPAIPLSTTATYTTADGPETYRGVGNRISMDCFDLNEVVFVWEENLFVYEYPAMTFTTVNPGGLRTRALRANLSAAPFTVSSGTTRTIDFTSPWAKMPDVAFATSGTRARIAYINTDTLLPAFKNIIVRNTPFSNIYTGTGTVSFGYDDSLTAATNLFGPSDGEHVNIDCPDHFTTGDIWSVIYNQTITTMYAFTKPVSGPNVQTFLSNMLSGRNRYPVVAYNYNASEINYGWFAEQNSNYIANSLLNDGSTFATATPAGTYRNIALYMTGIAAEGRRLTFNRQNDRNNVFFMAYPLPGILGPGNWIDMRNKIVPWTSTSYRPTGIEEVSTLNGINVSPNPFTQGFQLTIDGRASTSKYKTVMTDVQGRIVFSEEGTLDVINEKLETLGNELSAGTYYLSVYEGDYFKNLKLVKH